MKKRRGIGLFLLCFLLIGAGIFTACGASAKKTEKNPQPKSEAVVPTEGAIQKKESGKKPEESQSASGTVKTEPVPTKVQGKDPYKTDPVPQGKPSPVEPEEAVVGEKKLTCTLSVNCGTILENIEDLDEEKEELIPKDGVILPATSVTFHEGESVFHVLQREMKRNKIHFEFVNTPIYNSAYIEGINNLYEFDCGELSGWMYKVNDWFPNYGCSRYQLKDGDVVEWLYSCDLGKDIGGRNELTKVGE